jgi:hypothetical protein
VPLAQGLGKHECAPLLKLNGGVFRHNRMGAGSEAQSRTPSRPAPSG